MKSEKIYDAETILSEEVKTSLAEMKEAHSSRVAEAAGRIASYGVTRANALQLRETIRARPQSAERDADLDMISKGLKANAAAADSERKVIAASEDNLFKHFELAYFEAWIAEERKVGRPENELTWGNCVRELGLLQERQSEPEPAGIPVARI